MSKKSCWSFNWLKMRSVGGARMKAGASAHSFNHACIHIDYEIHYEIRDGFFRLCRCVYSVVVSS